MNSKQKMHSDSTGSEKTAIFFLCIFTLALASLAFAGVSYAATIQGFKFHDLDGNGVKDAGEPTFVNHNIYVRENNTAINHTIKTDANGHYSITDLNAGTFTVWSGILNGWRQTSPVHGVGTVIHTVQADATQTLTVNFGVTDRGPIPPPPQDACGVVPTVESVDSGNWSDPNIWSTGTVPALGEWVRISGHEITVPNSIDLGQGGLCNRGIIWSGDNAEWQIPAKVRIHASSVHNSGDIFGKDGVKGDCGNYDTSGSSIEIWATLFVNDSTGSLHGGNGGGDEGGKDCDPWTCPGFGGDGGSVEIFSTTTINEGALIRSGDGGDAFGCHAHTIGGDGGVARIITNAFDPSNQSMNEGMIVLGNGGDSKSQPGMAHAGRGGDADLIMNNVASPMEGQDGSSFHWDPVRLKAGSNLSIKGFDDVEIYTDNGGSIDLSELKQGAVTASKRITIAAGKGSTVDLRGLSGKVFKAGEKIEIFADDILLDPGVSFKSLADAPDVVISTAKILYRVALSAGRSIAGEPGNMVKVPVKLINIGPTIDTYALSVTNSESWWAGGLPYNVTMGGLLTKELSLNVNFPTDSSFSTTITVTATSMTDPTVSATTEIEAYVKPSETDLQDSDNDGLNNYQEKKIGTEPENADTDADGMPDGWEIRYGLNPLSDDAGEDPDNDEYSNIAEYGGDTNPRESNDDPLPLPGTDDSITFSGSGKHKMIISSDPNGTAGDMKISEGADGSYIGSNGATSVVVIPDPSAVEDSFTITTGKNLTDTGEAISVTARPNDDGSYTFKDPASPTTEVTINEDSYIVTDTEFPGTVINSSPDGTQTITDTEFPGTIYTISSDGRETVTDEEFPGMALSANADGTQTITDGEEFPDMSLTLNSDDSQTVTDKAFPGMTALINEYGAYTVTDAEFPGVEVVYNEAEDSFTVTDAEFPDLRATFYSDGSYTLTDQDGNCYDVNKKARGWFSKTVKKFVNKAAKVVNKVAGFVKKTAKFVSKAAKFVGKVGKFVSKVAGYVAKAAPVVSKVFRAIGAGALAIGAIFPPLCPIACAISGFANGVATISDTIGIYAHKVKRIADKVVGYSDKIRSYADKVANTAAKVQFFAKKTRRWSRISSSRSSRRDARGTARQDCELITLYTASGIIRDSDNNPIPVVTVNMNDITTVTDDEGRWKIIALNDGDYTITGIKDGYTFTSEEFSVEDQNVTVSISVTDGQDDPDCEPVAVDMNTWTQEGTHANGNWVVSQDGKSVLQTINSVYGGSSLFVSPEFFIDRTFKGEFEVETDEDDDFVGFVFGFKNINDFYLFSWKQLSQTGAVKGFVLAHVTGGESNIPWKHQVSGSGYEVLATNLGTGWTDYTTYKLTLAYTSNYARIDIAGGAFGSGETIFNHRGSFPEGQFGFYNNSQASVRYGGFSQECASPSVFEAGVFTVESDGVIQIDWLYDGGAYKGELGIFSLKGMEDLEPGSEAFIAEAVRRVLSDSEEGHIILSDPTEGARFSGSLGETKNWNSGEYSGVKSFEMRPGDWFATILVPNRTFQALANNPGTANSHLRPLFSLVSTNPAHGMYLGQIADVNGMGTAFSYEDMSADNSDRDYNDLIIRITGATIDDVPSIDTLTGTDRRSRARRDRNNWFDWRAETELGKTIMEHLDAGIVGPETVWLSADIDTDAELLAYSPDGSMIGQPGGHIPGATFGTDIDGYCFVSLPSLTEGDYRLVIRSEQDESGTLTVRKHQGKDGILSEDSENVTLGAHETLVTDVAVYDAGDGLGIDVSQADESPAGPYDFDGNGEIDDTDIGAVSALWNVCEGDDGYVPFYDLDGDSCITILDIMRVVNSR